MEIEEVGTNWNTRPNQAAPTIQWVSIWSDPHIQCLDRELLVLAQVFDHVKQMEIEEVGTNWKTRPNLSHTHNPRVSIRSDPHILMTRQRISTITQVIDHSKTDEIEEVGTNWKTRPNQATPTIQGYQSGQTLYTID